jgi:putative aldouronate transport system substrate-binding protein
MLKLLGTGAASLALAACSAPGAAPQQEGAAGASKELVQITFVESWFGVPQYQASLDPVTEVISKQLQDEGLNIEIRSMILDDHATKYTVLYASGADFTMAFDAPWYNMNSLREQGALLEIEELINQHGANITSAVTPKIMDANYQFGHLYGIPTGFYYGQDTGPMLREDLRKKYGAPEPTSEGGYASLTPYLEAIRDNEAALIPFANGTYRMTDMNAWSKRGWLPGGVNNVGLIVPDPAQGVQLEELETQEWQIQAATLLRSWWENGLVNQTELPNTDAVPTALFVPGQCASYQENEPEFKYIQWDKELKSVVPEGEAMGYEVTGMKAGKVRGLGTLRQWNFVVFNASAPEEQQIAGIQYFNWLHGNQDKIDLWLMGVDGVNYKQEENLRFSEIEGVDQTRNYRRQWYVSGCPGRFQRNPIDLPARAEEALKFFSTEENWDYHPYEQFTVDRTSIEVELANMEAVYEEAEFGFSTGATPTEEALKTFGEQLDAAGRQKVKDEIQMQFEAWIQENVA